MKVVAVAPDIYLIEIKLHIPLKVLNAYALRGAGGWTLIDCGFDRPETRERWRTVAAELGFGPGDVEQIIVTHLHPDHAGAATWLQEWTGAPVLMHRPEVDNYHKMWHPESRQADDIGQSFLLHGMPESIAAAVTAHHKALSPAIPAVLRPFDTGAPVLMGNRTWQVIWTPGHTDGLAIFWCAADQILLCNDMVLNTISPNIQCLPNFDLDPLALYFRSLHEVARIPARLTLPGHRSPIYDLAARCRELEKHHHQRLEEVMQLVRPEGTTTWEVCQGLFAHLMVDVHNQRFAMAETLSHVVYLQRQGRLVAGDSGPAKRFRRV